VDALGSVRALTDASGAVQTTYDYQAYGATSMAGETDSNRYQFTGRENDGALYYNRARYYSTELGRFISEDPADFYGGWNLYQYALASPLNLIDPLGLYGISNCTYYKKRCKEAGGVYYCWLAPSVCDGPFHGPYFDCVRQCLQEFDHGYCNSCGGGSDVICIINIHQMCYQECIGGGPPKTYP